MSIYKCATVVVSSLAVTEGSFIHRDAKLDDVVFVSSSEGYRCVASHVISCINRWHVPTRRQSILLEKLERCHNVVDVVVAMWKKSEACEFGRAVEAANTVELAARQRPQPS
jgi:hypothetical protein